MTETSPTTSLNPVSSDKQHDVCLEQYKAYLSDLGNIGSRYATVQTGTLMIVCLFSIALCVVWALTIHFYQRLFRAKFEVLKAMEINLAYQCFEEEYRQLQPKPLLLSIEGKIPLLLSLFFFALATMRLITQ